MTADRVDGANASGAYAAAWAPLFRHREGSLAPVMVTLYRDNLGGLVLFMDEGDGTKVIGVPLPRRPGR
jgi:hypothetical protein